MVICTKTPQTDRSQYQTDCLVLLAKVVNILWQEQVKLHFGYNPIHMQRRRRRKARSKLDLKVIGVL